MATRVVVGVVLGTVLLAGIAGAASVTSQQSSPTYVPDRVGGYEQMDSVSGSQARQAISQLHQNPDEIRGFRRASVAVYGEDGQERVLLYVSVYNSSETATDDIQGMYDTIERSQQLDVNTGTVGQTQVHATSQGGAVFAFFSSGDAAYWITHPQNIDESTAALVEDVTAAQRQSDGLGINPVATGE